MKLLLILGQTWVNGWRRRFLSSREVNLVLAREQFSVSVDVNFIARISCIQSREPFFLLREDRGHPGGFWTGIFRDLECDYTAVFPLNYIDLRKAVSRSSAVACGCIVKSWFAKPRNRMLPSSEFLSRLFLETFWVHNRRLHCLLGT